MTEIVHSFANHFDSYSKLMSRFSDDYVNSTLLFDQLRKINVVRIGYSEPAEICVAYLPLIVEKMVCLFRSFSFEGLIFTDVGYYRIEKYFRMQFDCMDPLNSYQTVATWSMTQLDPVVSNGEMLVNEIEKVWRTFLEKCFQCSKQFWNSACGQTFYETSDSQQVENEWQKFLVKWSFNDNSFWGLVGDERFFCNYNPIWQVKALKTRSLSLLDRS